MKTFFKGVLNILSIIGFYLVIGFYLTISILLLPVFMPAILLCILLDTDNKK